MAVRADGGFLVASEGAGTVGDANRPFETFNLIIDATAAGDIDTVIKLPDSTNGRQVRFGFEGIASTGSEDSAVLYVAFQREWADDPDDRVRIGRYDVASGDWTFLYYPIEAPVSANGGWVGLSELTYLGDDEFAVVERDNQAGPDAVIKRIYKFSIADLTPLEDPAAGVTPSFPVVEKELIDDLMDDLQAPNGLVLEKIEGMAVLSDGTTLVVNDNDGVDDSNGETQLLRIDGLF
ncbi:MAG: esterase-like activity of phytase family protein [Gammaproteobacteria bacterium]